MLNDFGDALLAADDAGAAQEKYESALARAATANDLYGQARAHHGIGRVLHAMARLDESMPHFASALALYLECGTPEAAELSAWLGQCPATAAARAASRLEQ